MGKYEMLTFVTSVPSAQISNVTAGDGKTWKKNLIFEISQNDDDVNSMTKNNKGRSREPP